MTAARKKAQRQKVGAAPRRTPAKDTPWYARVGGLSAALLAVAALVGIGWQIVNYGVRHFRGAEVAAAAEPMIQRIAPIEETASRAAEAVAQLIELRAQEASLQAAEQARLDAERDRLERDCRLGVLTFGECARRSLGRIHPDYAPGVKR